MLNKLKQLVKTFPFYVATLTLLTIIAAIFVFLQGDEGLYSKRQVKKIYYADNISRTHQLLIDKFNKLHQGKIEVVPINLPFEKFSTNERKELLIRYLRSKSDRIDIFSVDQIWVPRFAKWAEPLNKYFLSTFPSGVVEQSLRTCYYKNDLVAIPIYVDLGLLYYNADLLKKSPNYASIRNELSTSITWERFIEIGKQLKFLGRPIYIFPADDYEGLMCSFVEMLGNYNEDLIAGDTVRLNTPAAEKALQLLVNIVNDSQISPKDVLNFTEFECERKFIKDDGLFMRGWPGFYTWYRDFIDSQDISSKFLIAPMPHFKGAKPTSIVGGWDLMVSKYSTQKNEAIEFIKFLISEESQQTLFEQGGYLPVIKKVYSNKKFVERNPRINFYKNIMATGYNRPFQEKYTRSSDVISYYLNLAMRKQIGVKEALLTAQHVINSGQFFMK